MLKRFLLIVGTCLVLQVIDVLADNLATLDPRSPSDETATTKEVVADAVIVGLIIAGSIALYKARGRPCACPSDTMRNGRACGSRSAWSKAGGAKPLCFPTDITSEMISAYRATKAIPPVW